MIPIGRARLVPAPTDRWYYRGNIFGYSIYGVFRQPWLLIREPYYRLKWFLQRGFRGYDDPAVWNMHSWLSRTLPPMLETLSKTTYGYPPSLTPGKWQDILLDISYGFKAAHRVIEMEWTELKEVRRDRRTFQKGMKLFAKYFFNLWD